jgi:hypothetical protein
VDYLVEEVCAAHAILLPQPLSVLKKQRQAIVADDTVFKSVHDVVLDEQQTKDAAFAAILRGVARLQRYIDADGSVDPIVFGRYTATWSGTPPSRKVTLSLANLTSLTGLEKTVARAALLVGGIIRGSTQVELL